ncbi:MAG: type 1 glutamine amidotransferase [Rhodobacteraceae bacterium]|nr:type 1 glutamine amidotransferase [Paracoccaceae bacterium]
MHIAVLMTNTDESEFSQSHPKDGAKFAAMIHSVRPDWKVTNFAVKDGIFPPEDRRFDGWLITGSPASVHDSDPWINRLKAMIRRLDAERAPLFGACFGHQVIAEALGGHVGQNPGGWVFGLTETMMDGQPIRLYASHIQQVLDLPPGAEATGGNADCPVGSFKVGDHILTTQYHPEMSHIFITALVEEYADDLPIGIVSRARADLAARQANSAWIAERIARFFEAAQDRAASKSIAVT